MQVYIASFALAEGSARSVQGFDLSAEESVETVDILRAQYAPSFHRLNTKTSLRFNVSRVWGDAITAQNFLVTHHASMPKTGTVTIVIEDPSGATQRVYIKNCVNKSSKGAIHGACTTVNSYELVGGQCTGLAPGPASTYVSRIDAISNGSDSVDVVFDAEKTNDSYSFDELVVVNVDDAGCLRIWPAIITAKTRTGFTVLLNGNVDSGNYKLRSTVSITP